MNRQIRIFLWICLIVGVGIASFEFWRQAQARSRLNARLDPMPQPQQAMNVLSVVKNEAIRRALQAENVPISFFAKLVDQNENPIEKAKIQIAIRQWGLQSLVRVGTFHRLEIESDDHGAFSITNQLGDVLTVEDIIKDGFKLSSKAQKNFGFNVSKNSSSGPERPIVFKMWKKTLPQRLTAYRISRSAVPCDGKPIFFDLKNGTKVSEGGDLKITFLREPLNLLGKEKFNWEATFEILGGGLQETMDEFGYWAPRENYQSNIKFTTSRDSSEWTSVLKKEFYFKTKESRFGRVSLRLTTNYQPPPTGISFEITFNPSGSQSLEPLSDESEPLESFGLPTHR